MFGESVLSFNLYLGFWDPIQVVRFAQQALLPTTLSCWPFLRVSG